MDRTEVTPEASPDDNRADESQPQEPSPTTDNKDNPPAKKANVRKRTKTGCLTCRKRRIKCDEGKPTCNNCIKSKRQCEGYNTRVIFKEPMGTFQGGPFGPIVYHPDPTDALVSAQLSSAQSKSSSSQGGPLPIIAPKPPSVDFGTPATFQYAQAYQAPRTDSSSSMSFNHMPYRSHYHAGNPPPFPSDSQRKSPYHGHTEKHDAFHYHNASEAASHIHQARDDVPHSVRQQANLHRSDRPDLISPAENPQAAYIGPATEDEYWYSDDDASMGESDDEFGAEQHAANLASNDLGVLVARRLHAPFDMYGTQVRSFHTFADDNILATYIPSSTNSPLNDAQTAAIFWYFVNVTGPSMSLYERHPFDPSPMFQGEPVPKTKQHIWTYTFPIISFNHPALLQAMLALGSLQMAKLQGVPATASMKHYHLSLRRVAKNYQSNSRRAQPATLAATLLLGFYEVWNSDHDKWCKHMWGARAIIKEIPLRQMTQSILAMKRRRRQRLEELRRQQQYDGFIPPHNDYIDNDVEDVDVNLVRELTGRPICFEDEYGAPPQANIRYTERDLENYEHVSDLYWWYCKMDVYQSFLGATKLFLEYEKWTQCIPRAPIGRIDAIYGTFDHLMLVLGRLASFASIDMARKKRAMKERGGPGGPGRPGGPGGPGGGRGGPPGPPGQGNSPPMFAGMMPSSGRVTVPSGFSPPRDMPSTEGSDEVDLDTSTKAALEEWTAIRRAFEVFKSKLGPDFEPMSSEFEPPQATPFGLALTYRTYSIAGIWMNYYMGMIALYRAHPSMPPFAMVAAGMAARSTAGYAIEIGRIAAGLAEDCTTVSAVSTLVGAAFIESCFCLFVAGVQYQDPVQRHWTIKRLHDIARLTGWQSARQIANGCESAWRKAAELGHGLPYERDPNLAVEEHESVWQNPRRIDARIKELSSDEDKLVLAKSERAHYALGLLSVEQDLEKLDLQERG